MNYVYIVESLPTGRFYVGCTSDLRRRISEHNAGKTKSLRASRPVRLVYHEEYGTLSEARQRERYLKRMKSRAFLLDLIESNGDGRLVQRENACFTRKRS